MVRSRTVAGLAATFLFLLSQLSFSPFAVTGLLSDVQQATAAGSTITCDRTSAQIGEDVTCTVIVTRPSGDTGATHINVGMGATGPTHVLSATGNSYFPYCIVGYIPDGGHTANCFNYNPYAQAPAQYLNVPYDVPLPITFVVHVDGCGSGAAAITTTANVYGVNSPVISLPLTVPACGQSNESNSGNANGLGCIEVLKETFDYNGNILTPVQTFGFRLDNGETVQNDSNGRARFNNVTVGTHTVSEISTSQWTQVLVTPVGGLVQVSAGSSCAAVVFKNRLNTNNNNGPQCSDGRDNDNDSRIDFNDPGCHYDGNPNNPGSYNPNDNDEFDNNNTLPQCNDGRDNDNDGRIDAGDPGCTGPTDNDERDNNTRDATVTIDDSPDPVRCEEVLHYGIRVHNNSTRSDTFTVRMELPDDVILLNASEGGYQSGDYLNWNLRLSDNETRTLRVDVRVRGRACDVDTLRTTVTIDGDSETETTRVDDGRNRPECDDGIDNDRDGRIDERDPDCSGPNDDSEGPTGGIAQCNDGRDNDNDGRIDALDPGCTGPTDNDERDTNGTPGRVTVQKYADRNEASPGDQITYTVTIRNEGSAQLQSVRIEDNFPLGQITIIDPGSAIVNGGRLEWFLGAIGPNETRSVTYRAVISSSIGQGAVIHNEARVTGDGIVNPPIAGSDVHILQRLPQTGPGDFTGPLSDTHSFLRPFSAGGVSGMPAFLWLSMIASGLGLGVRIGKKYFI